MLTIFQGKASPRTKDSIAVFHLHQLRVWRSSFRKEAFIGCLLGAVPGTVHMSQWLWWLWWHPNPWQWRANPSHCSTTL